MNNTINRKGGTALAVGIIVAVVVLVIMLGVIGVYNSLNRLNVDVDSAWSKVETSYQRRADLIPNLIETVKGAKNFEQETLIKITEARSAWTNAKTSEEKVAAANGMESALSRLMVVVESYPELKSNQNFLALQDELANTENKISVERNRYNDAVTLLNRRLVTFPTNMIAGMFNIGKRSFFQSAEGAENAPKVDFN
ncbi:MAG: LemA family protein [archaeon]